MTLEARLAPIVRMVFDARNLATKFAKAGDVQATARESLVAIRYTRGVVAEYIAAPAKDRNLTANKEAVDACLLYSEQAAESVLDALRTTL